jgi:L-ascorbate metabolism protein UlaG (beta-lactamase superfamily)
MPSPSIREPQQYIIPATWSDDRLTVGWIGHSTVLINFFGKWILTDPVLGNRVGVNFGKFQFGIKRHVLPAIRWEDLPKLDYIFLSHAHMDHFDFPTLKRLSNPKTKVITARNTATLLAKLPFGEIYELGGKESLLLEEDLRVQAVPVRHWGNRFPWNRHFGYTGYLIERKGHKIFFPGDTAYTNDWKWLREFGEIDVAFLPIGAYSPDSYQKAHCTPEQAWDMFEDTGSKYLVPIHWNTFVLSREPVKEPLQRLKAAAGENVEKIVITEHGGCFTLLDKNASHLSSLS